MYIDSIRHNVTRTERARARAASDLAATISAIVAALGPALPVICATWAERTVGIDGMIQRDGAEIRAIQIARAVVLEGDHAGAFDERGEELYLTADGRITLAVVEFSDRGLVSRGEWNWCARRAFRHVGTREALRTWSAGQILSGLERALEDAARLAQARADAEERDLERLARVRAALGGES